MKFLCNYFLLIALRIYDRIIRLLLVKMLALTKDKCFLKFIWNNSDENNWFNWWDELGKFGRILPSDQ